MSHVRIGTRGSALALAQATEVKVALEQRLPGTTAELVIITTSGDDATRGSADTLPGDVKGVFVKELEEALLDATVDVAVHSVKDLPTELPDGLTLGAIVSRRDPRDAVATPLRVEGPEGVPPRGITRDVLRDLPAGARVGASSLRRQAQVKRLRRDVELVPIRGNVDTRLTKLDRGEYDAVIVAACGLMRLGLEARIAQRLEPAQMLPAPGQGALGIELRADRDDLRAVCAALDDPATRAAVSAERALLKALGGGCQVPIAALATIDASGNLTLEGAVFSPEGLRGIRQSLSGAHTEAERIGATLASHLRAKGADRLLFGQKAQPWYAGQSTS